MSDAAYQLDKSESALHRIETGETKANVHLVRSMMDLYRVLDAELLNEAREASSNRASHEAGRRHDRQ